MYSDNRKDFLEKLKMAKQIRKMIESNDAIHNTIFDDEAVVIEIVITDDEVKQPNIDYSLESNKVIDKALKDFDYEKIKKKLRIAELNDLIDEALLNNNKDNFMTYTHALNQMK